MDQKTLDDAYSNTQADPDWGATYARLQAASAALYHEFGCIRDIAYAPKPRQRFDYLVCGAANPPLFIFIHGGYWQKCTKADFAISARGPLERGFDVVLAEYTLA